MALTHLLNDIPNEWLGCRIKVIIQVKVGMALYGIRKVEDEVDIMLGLGHGGFDVGCRSDYRDAF
jgi:hypothetical protein